MKRNHTLNNRVKFCKLAINDNKKAAQELRNLADGLEGCRTVSDVVLALSDIFCVSERTIFGDLCK